MKRINTLKFATGLTLESKGFGCPNFIEALGGEENILEMDAAGLYPKVHSLDLVKKKMLKKANITITKSKGVATLAFGDDPGFGFTLPFTKIYNGYSVRALSTGASATLKGTTSVCELEMIGFSPMGLPLVNIRWWHIGRDQKGKIQTRVRVDRNVPLSNGAEAIDVIRSASRVEGEGFWVLPVHGVEIAKGRKKRSAKRWDVVAACKDPAAFERFYPDSVDGIMSLLPILQRKVDQLLDKVWKMDKSSNAILVRLQTQSFKTRWADDVPPMYNDKGMTIFPLGDETVPVEDLTPTTAAVDEAPFEGEEGNATIGEMVGEEGFEGDIVEDAGVPDEMEHMEEEERDAELDLEVGPEEEEGEADAETVEEEVPTADPAAVSTVDLEEHIAEAQEADGNAEAGTEDVCPALDEIAAIGNEA
jgi:Fe-S-cluster formation regulator IscX/YfhJ